MCYYYYYYYYYYLIVIKLRAQIFSLLLDKSTDVARFSQLLAYIRFSGKEDMQNIFCFANHFQSQQPVKIFSR